MAQGTAAQASTPAPENQKIDPAQIQYAIAQLRSHQNLAGGALAGLAAALVGAAIWAGITLATHYQIGWMAVGIGFLVGFAIRSIGRGIDRVYGYVGAGLSLLGCAAGNLLTVCAAISQQHDMPILDVLSRLTPYIVQQLMVASFSPMDVLFYAIAVYEGYRLSFRQVTMQEVRTLLTGA
ncbi:MAG TPA: hypothetical protein VMW19_16305 [Myxococcota bacterium]|nr:hypothetical protein [Myxococcota bacterium]